MTAPEPGAPRACPTGTPTGTCVTCSDEAVAVVVVKMLGDGLATVETGRGREEVSVALVDARIGDTVLVHAKEAIAVVRG
ncbi:HypC/HybG/HupF family hydrogenase formation chaperone [Microbispora sp. RL4-1S]|uniref:HypC/HybG/HupF family hydrogenase formation chaperone n=1 Tax=Microbispora oryzae TaxID=2806554 RepID=A0A940WIV0_9ACTN|nr:HypC/HybG/HupF family hydrogenase formation chaperone [Microbispora oryzae]MBP2706534.1 HypC/HybG/HupF family hydrogenase formation chaperone [Microbispora oryzae]